MILLNLLTTNISIVKSEIPIYLKDIQIKIMKDKEITVVLYDTKGEEHEITMTRKEVVSVVRYLVDELE